MRSSENTNAEFNSRKTRVDRQHELEKKRPRGYGVFATGRIYRADHD
jgi:hypothetical protein